MKAIERIKQYIDFKGVSNRSFELENDLSNGYIATQLKRNADLGEGVLNKILDNCLDIDSEWLLTGKGQMLKRVSNSEIQEDIVEILKENSRLLKEKIELIERLSKLESENAELRTKLDIASKSTDRRATG